MKEIILADIWQHEEASERDNISGCLAARGGELVNAASEHVNHKMLPSPIF